jgi:aldose 1-epimerase
VTVSGSPPDTVVLASSAIELTVLPQRGARLHRLRVHGHDLLRTPDGVQRYDDEPFFWGAFVMAPWCNRLAAQPTQFGGREVDLVANFRDGTAIHGQVYDRVWSVDGEGAFSITAGGNGWPWPYRVGHRLTMPTERTVRIEQSLTNMSDEVMPGGLGLHPWFRRPVQVAVNGGAVHPTNGERAPAEPVSGQLDLRQLSELPDGIDGAWTDLAEPAAELHWPQFDLRAVMRVEGAQRYVVVASPPEVDALAIEPQTHAAFGLGRLLGGERGGLALIKPREQMQLITELEFIRGAGGGRGG